VPLICRGVLVMMLTMPELRACAVERGAGPFHDLYARDLVYPDRLLVPQDDVGRHPIR